MFFLIGRRQELHVIVVLKVGDIISAVAATNKTFSSSRTTCRISITCCSALKSKVFYRLVAIVRITNPKTVMHFVILVPLLIKVIQKTATDHVQMFFILTNKSYTDKFLNIKRFSLTSSYCQNHQPPNCHALRYSGSTSHKRYTRDSHRPCDHSGKCISSNICLLKALFLYEN